DGHGSRRRDDQFPQLIAVGTENVDVGETRAAFESSKSRIRVVDSSRCRIHRQGFDFAFLGKRQLRLERAVRFEDLDAIAVTEVDRVGGTNRDGIAVARSRGVELDLPVGGAVVAPLADVAAARSADLRRPTLVGGQHRLHADVGSEYVWLWAGKWLWAG